MAGAGRSGGAGRSVAVAGPNGSATHPTTPIGQKILIGILAVVMLIALVMLVDMLFLGGPLTSGIFGNPGGPSDSVNTDSPNGGTPTGIPTDTATGSSTDEPTSPSVTTPSIQQTEYSITIDVNDARLGTARSNIMEAPENVTIQLDADPGSGCEFVYWEVTYGEARLRDIFSPSTSFTMPGGDVSVRAHFREQITLYEIEIIENDPAFGRAGADLELAERGNTVNIYAEPNPGYVFERWEIVSGDLTIENSSAPNTSFTMPGHAISIIAYFGEAGLTEYNINVTWEPSEGGSAIPSHASAPYEAPILITVAPAEGFEFDHIEIVWGDVIEVTTDLWFIMPDFDVFVRVYFRAI